MNHYQKQYIEDNINLIENKEWNKFFTSAPEGIGSILYASDISFMSDMEEVPYNAFCHDKNIKSVIIPDRVTRIGGWAFYKCSSPTSVTIPNSVKSIGSDAFSDCESLTSVNFCGTKAQWKAIKKAKIFNKIETKIICTDGVIGRDYII